MRYIVDIPQAQADSINNLIRENRYQSVAQFILAAIENQIFIESSDAEPERSSDGKTLSVKEKYHDENGYPERNITVNLKMPHREILPSTVPMPRFDQVVSSLSPDDENNSWLWGQWNKIFPVKLGSRVLLILLGSDQWIELGQFKERAADLAFSLGAMLHKYEDRKDKKRGEKISAGLPGGIESFKSKMRYKSHFLGYMRKDDKIDGAMPFLKLANMYKDEKGKVFIGLTEPGAKFARLENPAMDLDNLDRSLGDKEIEFYLGHVTRSVPGEFKAIQWLLSTISEGITNREHINQELRESMGKIWDASDAVINTQRAGLSSRASELGLINTARSGNGAGVVYRITNRGTAFLSKQ